MKNKEKSKKKRKYRSVKSVLPIVSLDEAAKRLNDPDVWRKASKGFRFKD